MKSLIVLTFNRLPQAKLGEFAANVINNMTINPVFVNLKPHVDELKIMYDAYLLAVSNAANGGRLNTMIKNDRMKSLVNQLGIVARYVDVMASGSEMLILEAGFEVRKANVPVTELTTPTGVVAKNLERTGVAKLKWDKVVGATNYAIKNRVKGTIEWKNGVYSTARSTTVKDLEPGKLVEFQIYAMGTKGLVSDVSQIVEVLVS